VIGSRKTKNKTCALFDSIYSKALEVLMLVEDGGTRFLQNNVVQLPGTEMPIKKRQ
jgi:hypothetical protein